MKTPMIVVALVASAIVVTANAQPANTGNRNNAAVSTQKAPATHKAIGVVKSVNPAKNAVVLVHEPVKSLNWPVMTMAFGVRSNALLDKLTVHKTVEFEFVQEGTVYVITSVK
jgi:Cu(I)/Ag(I) efflux system periplasmic protein CusF